MPTELGRALVAADRISPEALADARFHAATRGVSLARALVEVGALDAARLQDEIDRASHGAALGAITVHAELAAGLPEGLAERLCAVPIGGVEQGAFRVGVVDASDRDALAAIGRALGAPVFGVRVTLAALDAALARFRGDGAANLPIPLGAPRRLPPDATPPYGVRALFPEVDDDDAEPLPLSRPARSKSPVALAAVPLPDVSAVFAAIKDAHDRDRVVDLLVAGARTVARRVALFVVRRDGLVGYRATSLFGDAAGLRRVRLPFDDGNALAAVARGEAHVGPLADVPANAPLLCELGVGAGDVIAVPVDVGGIAALVVLADEISDASLAATRLGDLARVAGAALERIVRARRP